MFLHKKTNPFLYLPAQKSLGFRLLATLLTTPQAFGCEDGASWAADGLLWELHLLCLSTCRTQGVHVLSSPHSNLMVITKTAHSCKCSRLCLTVCTAMAGQHSTLLHTTHTALITIALEASVLSSLQGYISWHWTSLHKCQAGSSPGEQQSTLTWEDFCLLWGPLGSHQTCLWGLSAQWSKLPSCRRSPAALQVPVC